jgi:two-component system, LytTR family, response regulator
MSPVKAIIVDDEQHCIDTLSTMLKKHFPVIEVAGSAHGVEEAKKMIESLRPGLVFLDVEMPHYNGFELFKFFEKPSFDVIFITAYESYALRAIKFNALDYLLKPYSRAELAEAVEKFLARQGHKETPDISLKMLMQNLNTHQHSRRKIALPTTSGLTFVSINDIIRCESVGNYTRIYFTNKSDYLVSRTLKELEYLLDDSDFYRIHHSHLINLQHMQSYQQGDGGYALMSDGSQVEVSRRKKADFLKRASQL